MVTVADMRDKLHTVDEAREWLAQHEPLSQLTFPANSGVQFRIEDPAWGGKPMDEPLAAYIRTTEATQGGQELQLTKQSLLEAGAQVGIPRKLQSDPDRMPSDILQDLLNRWFRSGAGDREFKLLSRDTDSGPVVQAMCRGTVSPFSNTGMLDIMLERIASRYGQGEVLVDYKTQHTLEDTRLRLIVPSQQRVIEGTRAEDDLWSVGLDYYNSLIGLHPTSMQGYLFRWWCTNGSTENLAESGAFSRRGNTTEEEAFAWAQQAVDEALAGLEGAFEGIQSLTSIPVEGQTSIVLRDLFAQYNIPARERQRVLDNMADLGGDLTMYDLQNAITATANMEGLSPRAVAQLLEMGGHVVTHSRTGRCQACRRIFPEGFEPPAAAVPEAN